MNLIDVSRKLGTEDQCLDYIENMRWPDGVKRCPTCGGDKLSRITRKSTSKNKRTRIYQCLEPTCKQQFSPTAGTIFHDSHLPLTKWFMGIAIVLNAKKGVSALQLQRDLGIGSYRTAWYLYHRIREAMPQGTEPLGGTVEIDETWVGGREQGQGKKHRKEIVVGVRQRGGSLRMFHTDAVTHHNLADCITKIVSPDVEMIMTDEYPAYPKAMIAAGVHGSKHKTIRHKDRVYVNGDIHTNTIESAFSLLKRGITGNFHQVSIKHLQRYLNEFCYRFDRREVAAIFDETVQRVAGMKPLTYRALVSKA